MTRRQHDDTLLGLLGRFRLREILGGDLLIGVLAAVGAGVLANTKPELVAQMAVAAVGLVGVVIGVVLGAASLIVAFLNPTFLRKLRTIGEDPIDYLAPYFLTGVLATIGSILAIVLAASPSTAPSWWLVPLAASVALFGGWAIASNIPNLTNLLRFIRLQQDAAEVPDDLPNVRPLGERNSAETSGPGSNRR